MKRFSIIHIPLLSFFSKDLYKDVGLNWKGVGFGYLLLLLVICSIPRMFKIQSGLTDFVNTEAPPLIEQIPRITITKGEVSIDEPQPYYIRYPDSNDVFAIIDTTGTIQSLNNTDALVLVTKTKLISRKSEVEFQTYDLSQVENFVLDKDRITSWLNTTRKLLVPVLYPFIVLGSFSFRIVQALIYAAIGLLFASWCKVKLSYTAMLRLAVVAITPCIIVKAILVLSSIRLPMAGLWFFLIAMVYLFFGVKAISRLEEPPSIEGGILPERQEQNINY